jgi:hypothetical protein
MTRLTPQAKLRRLFKREAVRFRNEARRLREKAEIAGIVDDLSSGIDAPVPVDPPVRQELVTIAVAWVSNPFRSIPHTCLRAINVEDR